MDSEGKIVKEITYNNLNLPVELTINESTIKAQNYYTYSATGTKLRVKRSNDRNPQDVPLEGTSSESSDNKDEKTTDYVGNFIYENKELKTILLGNGYYDYKNKKYYFYIKDHLGNNRIVADLSGEVEQSNQYYPFGMSYSDDYKGKDNQPYKYNGKELDEEHGLNWYDYSARYYDPIVPRFTSIDPLAEKYYSISPYAYVANNPINAIDPRGDSIWFTIDKNVATLHYVGKIINMSSDNLDMADASSDITSAINKAFEGASINIGGKNYNLNTDIQISTVSSMSDVASSDHLFVMADNNNPRIYGVTNEVGGKVVHLNASGFHNEGVLSKIFGVTNNSRSGAHEAGHTFGLEHPNPTDIGYSSTKDIMVQGGKGTKFQEGSVLGVYQNWTMGILNRGVNSTTVGGLKMPNQGVKNGQEKGTIGTLGFKYR